MGYTITIRPRSPKLAQEMLAFCKEHLRPLPEVADDYNLFEVRGPLPAPELSYCQRPTHIGFDYGPGVIERAWCYCLLQWMAVKVGVRKQGLPCYLYDGGDWIVLDRVRYDDLGQDRPEYRPKSVWAQILMPMPDKLHKKMRAEIQRLDKLWEESRSKLKK